MKYLAIVFCLLFFNTVIAQSTHEGELKSVIKLFFEGFHKQDSILINSVVSKDVILQTISKNKEGNAIIKTDDFSEFLKSIVSIPNNIMFEEKLFTYNIKRDNMMANIWVDYEFWINEKFSHCGVNSFQLFNDKGTWKIIYIIDTRYKERCNN